MKHFTPNKSAPFCEPIIHGKKVGVKVAGAFKRKFLLLAKVVAITIVILFSSSVAEAATRTWAGGYGTGKDWTLASNWAEGFAPATGDDIVFNTATNEGTLTFSIMPPASVSYNSLTITRGIIILANTGASITLTIGGNAGVDLFINSSRSLSLESNISITLATNSTATISGGLLIKNGGIYNTGNTGAITTVTGTIYNYGDVVNDPRDPYNPSAVISTTSSNLIFALGSSYQHLREGSAIPKATWALNSTCIIRFTVPFKIERDGNGIPPAPASFAQEFGNLTWDCDQFYTAMSLAPYLTKVNGNLEITRTGVAAVGHQFPILTLTNSSTGILTVGGTLKIYSMVNFDGGTISAGSTTIYRNKKNTSAIVTVNSGTALTLASLTIGPYVAYAGDGAPNCPDCSELLTFNPKGGTVTINGDVTIHPSCALACKNSPVINIKGNLANNGSFIKDQESVSFNGSAAQFISGTSVTTFYNLNINNSNPAGVTLQSDARVWNTLSFTNGKITTGVNTLTLDLNATPISGAAAGRYVNGNLGISIPPNTTSKTFTIGDATNYTPVTLTFSGTPTNSIGNIIASTKNVVHPNIATTGMYGIDPAKKMKRYFTLINNGVTFGAYNASFTFINPGDLDIGTDPLIYMLQRFSPISWFSTNVGTRTTTTIEITGGSQTDFGDFQAGQMKCTVPLNTFTVTGGGSFCVGNTGAAVGLSGSQAGVNYQLMVNGVNTGSPVPGGGSTISFGNQSASGTYTVRASRVLGGCYSTMSNSVTIP